MHLIGSLQTSFVICALLAQTAGATVIIQSSGNSEASVPIGYYAPYAQDNLTPAVYAVAWTQTSDYTDVDVFANLFTSSSPEPWTTRWWTRSVPGLRLPRMAS